MSTNNINDRAAFEVQYRQNVDQRAADQVVEIAWRSAVGKMWRTALSSTLSNLTEGEISLPNPADLRSAARMVRERLKAAPATAHWSGCAQSVACEEAADYFDRLAATKAAAPADAPTTAKKAAVRFDDADNLSVMLWLLRRLPRAYENPPHVVEPIRRLARITGIDVEDALAERRAAPTPPGEGREVRS